MQLARDLSPVSSRTHKTQVGRALAQLGIEHIASYSPQASLALGSNSSRRSLFMATCSADQEPGSWHGIGLLVLLPLAKDLSRRATARRKTRCDREVGAWQRIARTSAATSPAGDWLCGVAAMLERLSSQAPV